MVDLAHLPMRIAFLHTDDGRHSDLIAAAWTAAVARTCDELGVPLAWELYKCWEKQLPDVEAYDAFIIGGSHYNVCDQLDWYHELRSFVHAVPEDKPLIGSCFGAQFIAWAHGGTVDRNNRNGGAFRFGIETMKWTDDVADADAKQLCGISAPLRKFIRSTRNPCIFIDHGYCITSLPPQFRVLAESPTCSCEIAVSNRILCVQSHPEFSLEDMRNLKMPAPAQHSDTAGARDRDENDIMGSNDGAALVTTIVQFMLSKK